MLTLLRKLVRDKRSPSVQNRHNNDETVFEMTNITLKLITARLSAIYLFSLMYNLIERIRTVVLMDDCKISAQYLRI